MRATTIVVCSVAAAGCLLSAVRAQSWKAGDAVPDFSATGDNGKTYTLASFTKKGPAVFYFIKVGCPINDQALEYYIRIADAYKGAKVPFTGVINTDLEGFKTWNSRPKVPFRVLLDPHQKLISSWKAQRSPWVIVVGKDHKVVKEWPGVSSTYLKELSELIAKSSGVGTKTCDFSGSPTNPRPG